MKTSHIFWGTLFIVLGLLILINNFTPIDLSWGNLWQFWPVVLVLLGISMLVKNVAGKSLISGAAAIILAVVLFASVKYTLSFIFNEDYDINIGSGVEGDYAVNEYTEAFDSSITTAILYLEGGAGTFRIGSETDDLIYAKTEGLINNFNFNKNQLDSVANINLNMQDANFSLGKTKFKNKVDVALNKKPKWDLDFKLGAASIMFDFSKYNVEDINLDMGAASLDVKLGALAHKLDFKVNAGASKIIISVPEEVGCEISTDAVLSTKNISGFEKIESDLYRTSNFNNSEKNIFIDISCGVSSIEIYRYNNTD